MSRYAYQNGQLIPISGGGESSGVQKTDIAPIENGNNTSQPYAIGEEFYRNNVLCRAKVPIASGTAWSALTLGTDYEAADSVSSQIRAIANNLDREAVTRSIMGAKNLCPPGPSGNSSTTTFDVNEDGTITVNATGEKTSASYYTLFPSKVYKKGTYILSGCPDVNGETSKMVLYIPSLSKFDGGSGVTFTLNKDTELSPAIKVNANTVLTDVVVKPMIRLATDSDDTYEPWSMTNQELTENIKWQEPYTNSQSNPNLLDNPWFTINQRGESSYENTGTGYMYTLDRWVLGSSNSNKTLTVGNVSLINVGSRFAQYIPISDFPIKAGDKYTMSVIIDGELYSWTFKMYDDGQTHDENSGDLIDNIRMYKYEKYGNVRLFGLINLYNMTTDHIVTAMKLEKGTVSTLANDNAPNYQQELAKCQRYFINWSPKNNGYLLFSESVTASNSNIAYSIINIPVPLRTTPSIQATCKLELKFPSGSAINVPDTKYTVVVERTYNTTVKLKFTFDDVTVPTQSPIYVGIGDTPGVLTLSADL